MSRNRREFVKKTLTASALSSSLEAPDGLRGQVLK